jgi:peptidoglycan/xylan/chitin deacetylase (PgdA/CDA1 family)
LPHGAAAGLLPPDFKLGTSAQRQAGDCALTFDDGPGPHTGLLLDSLAKKGVKATFFVLGEHVRQHPDLIRRMVAEGHEVENHSWDHPDMRRLDPAARQREIEDTEAMLSALGASPHFSARPTAPTIRPLWSRRGVTGFL